MNRRDFALQLSRILSLVLILPMTAIINACTTRKEEEEFTIIQKNTNPLADSLVKEIHILTPAEGAILVIGQTFLISWEAKNVTNFNVQLYSGGNLIQTIVANETDFSFQWAIGPINTTTATIKVFDTSDPTVVDVMENPFTIVTAFEIDLAVHTALQSVGGYTFFEPPSLGRFITKRISATTFESISMLCTHNSCNVALQPDKSFLCPCHSSSFDAFGNVINGPAIIPLSIFRTEYYPLESKVVVFSY